MPWEVDSDSDSDVVIVGAGPTGLLLAGDLAARGVACTVLERRREQADTTTTRAFAVHARTLEQLDARGLADRLVATGATVRGLQLYGRVEIGFADLPSRFAYLLVTPQYEVEHLLEARALAAGARIVRGARAVDVSQDSEGVTIRTEAEAGAGAVGGEGGAGAESVYRAKYAVGTDGIHSTVRQAVGLPFPGRPVIRSIMLADVRFAEPPRDVLTVSAVGDAFAFIAPFGDGWYRVFCWNRRHQVPDTAPLELGEVRDMLLLAFKTDFGLAESRWLSRFHSDERQVPAYRVGRVFLAGDAAHCHSPAGGQGMNTGLQDAANLGWKLAAALQGHAADPDWVLDSYHAERYPVGRQVLRSSGAIVRLALVKPLLVRTARNVLSQAVMSVPPIAHKAMGMISGIGISYGRPPGANPGVGKRAGDLGLLTSDDSAPTRLYELLRDGKFALIARAADEAALSVAQDWKSEVGYAVGEQSPHALMLVRPDGYVGWASDEQDAAARSSAARGALGQWYGTPS